MLQPPRGTRDLLPPETIIKQKIIDRLRAVFELYGFDPVESPAIETWDTLSRKAGTDIERQIYRFKDKSGRDLGLRFDLTVPLARILSSRLDLPMPFKRYQIGPVWRYEEVKAGRRYREFWQADADIVGVSGIEGDAEILAVGIDGLMAIGIKDFYIRLNSRAVLERLLERLGVSEGKFLDVCRALDKLDKFSKDAVAQELKLVGLTEGTIKRLFSLSTDMLRKYKIDTTELDEMKRAAREWGFADKIKFDLNLARGLDYYTNIIFEFYVKGQEDIGAIAAGGRYDKLIGLFSKRPLPATGISFGIDRILG
ncbi:MAG: histidine--tRNA ligase, partial [Candidatus Aenigmatarchaeota archaeon]